MGTAALREIERRISIDAVRQAPEFAAFSGIEVALGAEAFARPALLGFFLRRALEAAWLRRRGVAGALAEVAAARVAAQFLMAEVTVLAPEDRAAVPDWVGPMAADVVASVEFLVRNFGLGAQEISLLREVWGWLGTAEALMETGGDIRLARDPVSGLNGYGCSHRPRPWAVTFASSTASSSSERGYAAADLWRLRVTAALLRGTNKRVAVRRALAAVRRGIARAYGLPAGVAVVLAASGTDCELLALALTHLDGGQGRIRNILLAPEETGRGVPMAARGVHFAVDTALGHDVIQQAPIAGFRPDTEVVNISLRDAVGGLRKIEVIEAEIEAAVGQGGRVMLHALDLSKTGLLAPGPEFLARLRGRFGGCFDIVVDACQARLSAESVRNYLTLDAVVLVTGSKFFTGPPFAGAALLPARVAARLAGERALPEGLAAYFGRDEFFSPCPAARVLPETGNYGLALRWHAALAEMRAFFRTAPARRAAILAGFGDVVREEVAARPALTLVDAPALVRGAESWEEKPSIFTFLLRAPHAAGRYLTPVEARAVYLWLNTDLSALLPGAAVASRICHIGQPVALPQAGGLAGALRVSAGARLVSGEPSHRGLSARARLAREFADLRCVFEKIELLLGHWAVLWAANPAPRYRPAQISLTGAGIRSPVM